MTAMLTDSDPSALLELEQIRADLAGAVLPQWAKVYRDTALEDFTATYERYVNKTGVPVKRLVLTGPEQVDGTAR